MVNESPRRGFNRILITFLGDNMDSAPAFGINSGVTAPIGLPQISVAGGATGGGFSFGGINNFPQGRGDNTETSSDAISWTHGRHIIKFGGEFRLMNSDNFDYTPGTFSFPTIAAFMADQANSFTVTSSNRSNRTYGNSLGAFVMDTWKMTSTFTLTLGSLRLVRHSHRSRKPVRGLRSFDR